MKITKTKILIGCLSIVLIGILSYCCTPRKYADALTVFKINGSKYYLLHVRLTDMRHTDGKKNIEPEATGDYHLSYSIATHYCREDYVLHVIPENDIYRLETRMLISHCRKGIEAWGMDDFEFKGYSTDENLLEAKILEYYLKNKNKHEE